MLTVLALTWGVNFSWVVARGFADCRPRWTILYQTHICQILKTWGYKRVVNQNLCCCVRVVSGELARLQPLDMASVGKFLSCCAWRRLLRLVLHLPLHLSDRERSLCAIHPAHGSAVPGTQLFPRRQVKQQHLI